MATQLADRLAKAVLVMIALLVLGGIGLAAAAKSRRSIRASQAPRPPTSLAARDSIGRLELPTTKTEATGAKEAVDNLPNAITLAGYGLGVWWCFGGPGWAALASIAADEVDGRVARATGEETSFGAELDFTSDVVLSGLALQRVGAPAWTVPMSTLASVAYRKRYGRPQIGSLRALIMLLGVAKGGLK